MRVIATAGHVDHGKSTLVRALTGINPDRLREEQRREMTIDLGFAWLTLPGGEAVGIIDVPGHIDFIDNMLAGIGGIDLALLVIAADEGPMPQTREHLAILQLLNVRHAVVALTKIDMVDAEWVELISGEIRSLLSGTPLADAPILPVSARAGTGLQTLVKTLGQTLMDVPVRLDTGKPRLPVDRVFTQQGFGTVVTGTLSGGALTVGDTVEIITPRGDTLTTHVRGLQSHKQKREQALPGSRVAVNVAGIAVEQVTRGAMLARPGSVTPTTRVDLRIEMLARSHNRLSLRHNTEVKVFCGAAQSVARVWLLDSGELPPGAAGWAQLELSTPMPLVNGDRAVIRLPSPSITVAGATIVDAHPAIRYRKRGGRADDTVLARLETLSAGAPEDRLTHALAAIGPTTRAELRQQAQLDDPTFDAAWTTLSHSDALEVNGFYALNAGWASLIAQTTGILSSFHSKQPLAEGMPRESLRSQLKLPVKTFDALLAHPGAGLVDATGLVRLSAHTVTFNPQQQRVVDQLLAQCRAQPWATPAPKECRAAMGDAVYDVLTRRRQLIQLNDDVMLLPETYEAALEQVRTRINESGEITAAQVRDLFGTTRKYALALLEYLDTVGVTKRVGDARVLK
jgi:selenocysteine-specific elongation factor